MSADPENTQVPSRQEREALRTTVWHLGRAMASFNRAPIPPAPKPGAAPGWWLALTEAHDALCAASDRLIDALETMPKEPGRG